VKRCGPLGGILTALKTSRARAVLFLACDMPLVSTRLLRRLIVRSDGGVRAVFVSQNRRAGFPCVLPVRETHLVERQMARSEFSVRQLATALSARRLAVSRHTRELLNVNKPGDRAVAEQWLGRHRQRED
jgi:molybdopterin-guanine dinucleotide biosynthesis protein A